MMSKKTLVMFLMLISALLATSGFFFYKYKGATAELKKKAEGVDKTEVLAVLDKVSKLIDLPTDEEPTVATVTDKEKLKEQKFFAKAENEDKVIIFVKAQKAILYRPSTNKIIEVARIDTIDQNKVQDGTSTESSKLKEVEKNLVVVLNGTPKTGLSNSLVEKMNQPDSIFEMAYRQVANRLDYERTLVVDLGAGVESANLMRDLLGVGELVDKIPEGEATPSGKLVVILGADYANVAN